MVADVGQQNRVSFEDCHYHTRSRTYGNVLAPRAKLRPRVVPKLPDTLASARSRCSETGIALFGPDASAATDSVAWELIAAFPHPFARPTAGPAAPQPPSRYAIARTPNGVNSNNSASDFAVTTKPTPGLPN